MSSRFQRLLVAVDASPRAAGVLRSAVALARAHGGKLILFRAVGLPLDIPPEAFSQPPAALPAILEAKAKTELESRAGDVPKELFEKTAVRLGVPWEAICQAAHEEDVDLIVIGSHGFSGIDRLLGTTAGRVVNHADRSVLVVREPPQRES